MMMYDDDGNHDDYAHWETNIALPRKDLQIRGSQPVFSRRFIFKVFWTHDPVHKMTLLQMQIKYCVKVESNNIAISRTLRS